MPKASNTVTFTGGRVCIPAIMSGGCPLKLIDAGRLAVMVKALLITVKAPDVAVKFLIPIKLMLKPGKVAIPLPSVV